MFLVMASQKPQARKRSETSTSQVVLKVIGIQAALLVAGLGIWLAIRYSASAPEEHAAHGAAERSAKHRSFSLPLALQDFATPSPGDVDPHSPVKESEFSRAFARLDNALHTHDTVPADEILAAANKGAGACPILWNDGEPLLMLRNGVAHGLDLSATLNGCADAVNKLP